MHVLIGQVYKMARLLFLFICALWKGKKKPTSVKVVNFEVFKIIYIPLQVYSMHFSSVDLFR